MWAARYLNNALFEPGGTDLYVWRDPAVNQYEVFGYVCGFPGSDGPGPAWHPLDEGLIVAFDEFENSVQVCKACGNCDPQGSGDNPHCLPLATQRIGLSGSVLGTEMSPPWDAGWMYLDLRFPTDQGSFGDLSQSFVSVTHEAKGLLSVGLPALELNSACEVFDGSQPQDF